VVVFIYKLIVLLLTAGLLTGCSCAQNKEVTTLPRIELEATDLVSSQPSASIGIDQNNEVVTTPPGTAEATDSAPSQPSATIDLIEPYSDVRCLPGNTGAKTPCEGNYIPEDIKTFWFNASTVFPGNEELAAQIIEDGKNPGLGVRSLHELGIIGDGVNVAIIDQNLAQPYHPDYKDRLIEYTDVGTMLPITAGSMHGPAVASLLVGQSCGVAPGADLYFAAAPSWTGDSKYCAEALRWIIEVNRTLPKEDKIRAVSVSAAPSGEGSPFTQNLEMWDEYVAKAKEDGILVLDCRVGYDTGIIAPGYYDPEAPEDITRFKTGFPQQSDMGQMNGMIFAPTSFRTTAEQYISEIASYQYTGQGGLSWGIPYAVGVLALGWQVDPSLSNEEIIGLLFDSAFIDADGNKIINPTAFIDAIETR